MIDREKLRYIFLEAEIIPWFHLPRFRAPSRSRWSRIFLHLLSAHVHAGIDLPRAIDASMKAVTHSGMRNSLQRVKTAIEEGRSLSEALREHAPRMFPKTLNAMIEVGEKTGTLGKILKMVESYYENSEALKRNVLWITAYPIIVFLFGIGMITFILIRIVPTFREIYADMETSLPAATQMLISLSALVRAHPLFLAIGFGCVAMAIILFIFLARRTILFSRILLWIPLVGSQQYHANQFCFSSLMSILLDSGIPVHEALPLCEGDMTLPVFRKSIERMRRLVSEGKSLSEAVSAQKLFSPMFRWLISVGEQRGDLASSLKAVSEYEIAGMQNSVVWAFSVFEPAIIIVNSVAIGFLVVAAWLPILFSGYLVM